MKNLKWLGNVLFDKRKELVFLSAFILGWNFLVVSQTFSKIYNYSGASQFRNITTSNYGFMIQGVSGDTTTEGVFFRSMLVSGFDFNGDTLFYKKYNSPAWNIASLYDVNTILSDTIFIVGNERRFAAVDTLFASLWWYNLAGDTIQTRQFSSPYYTSSNDPANSSWWMRPTSIAKSDDGQFLYLVCRVVDYPPLQNSFIVMKLSAEGELVWTYHHPFDENYYACDVVMHHEGKPWVIVAGVGGTNYPNILLGLNEISGFAETEIALPQGLASLNRRASDMIMLEDGIVVASVIFGEGSNLTPSMYKMSYEGQLLWQNSIPNGERIEQENDHLVQAQDGGFVCAAVSFEGGPTTGVPDDYNYVYRTWLWKVDANGNYLWDRKFEYLSLDSAYYNVYTFPHDLKATTDGGYIVAGEATTTCSNFPSCDEFIQQGWLLKVDACGCLVPGCDPNCIVSVEEKEEENEKEYFRFGPNPVGDLLNLYIPPLPFSIKELTFSLVDMNGRKIKDFQFQYDNTTYMIDAQSLAAGNYILSLTKDGQVLQSERMVKR